MNREELVQAILEFIPWSLHTQEDLSIIAERRDQLFSALHDYQMHSLPLYQRLCDQADNPAQYAIPTDLFRLERIASFPVEEQINVFHTSGTTQNQTGQHTFKTMALYDCAARHAAKATMFHECDSIDMLMLVPDAQHAPHSSLSYMCTRFSEWFSSPAQTTWAFQDNSLDIGAVKTACQKAEQQCKPLAILGTSFAFVFAEDALEEQRFSLPGGSFLMQTGGFKGRSREIDANTMHRLLLNRYGIPSSHLFSEYGMTELSSQFYLQPDSASNTFSNRYWIPPWVRVRIIDPLNGNELSEGEVGLLRIDDLANVDSVAAIQTADLAMLQHGSLSLLGRANDAPARGCSLSAEEAMQASVQLVDIRPPSEGGHAT